ncbi:MAG: hypothetical protein ACI8ZM_002048 [Crocinitomix sp.]|jgi:hypothetical protein
MKNIIYLFSFCCFYACSNNPVDKTSDDTKMEPIALIDSSTYSISINPINGLNFVGNIIITNTIYSLQTINYKNERCSFICKSMIDHA